MKLCLTMRSELLKIAKPRLVRSSMENLFYIGSFVSAIETEHDKANAKWRNRSEALAKFSSIFFHHETLFFANVPSQMAKNVFSFTHLSAKANQTKNVSLNSNVELINSIARLNVTNEPYST